MRKLNAISTVLILVLFLIHAIAGGFQLLGLIPGGNEKLTVLTWLLLAVICFHAVIGVILTVMTLKAIRKSGVSYGKENILFWTRRISGFAIMLFVILHLIIFLGTGSGASYRLNYFGDPQLVSQILLVITTAIHIITNIRPAFISFGIKGLRIYIKDILFILSIVMVFCGAAMIVYYMRWNILWK